MLKYEHAILSHVSNWVVAFSTCHDDIFSSRHDERVYWIVVLASDMANLPVDRFKMQKWNAHSLRAGISASRISWISIVCIFRSDIASRGSAPPTIRGTATQWSLRTADITWSPGEAVALRSVGTQGPAALRECEEAAKCLSQTRGGWVEHGQTMGPVECCTQLCRDDLRDVVEQCSLIVHTLPVSYVFTPCRCGRNNKPIDHIHVPGSCRQFHGEFWPGRSQKNWRRKLLPEGAPLGGTCQWCPWTWKRLRAIHLFQECLLSMQDCPRSNFSTWTVRIWRTVIASPLHLQPVKVRCP